MISKHFWRSGLRRDKPPKSNGMLKGSASSSTLGINTASSFVGSGCGCESGPQSGGKSDSAVFAVHACLVVCGRVDAPCVSADCTLLSSATTLQLKSGTATKYNTRYKSAHATRLSGCQCGLWLWMVRLHWLLSRVNKTPIQLLCIHVL